MDRGGRQASGEIDEVAQLMSRRSRPDALELSAALGAVERGLFGRSSEPLRLQRYTLSSRVGAGGLGVVYAAYDPQLDRKVAIKVLRDVGAGEHPSSGGRGGLLAEAQAIAQLSHPNVVAVHDVDTYACGELEDADHAGSEGVFIVMEFVEGDDLEGYSRKTGRARHEVIDRFIEAGQGLQAAHAAGIVHRDFKPQNAIVGSDGRVRVLDFGLARAELPNPAGPLPSAPSQVETLDGIVAGTPRYMSPEQHRGGPVDARSDQFSFCASLLACLSGEPPFAGQTLAELEASKSAGPEAALRGRDLSPWLARVLRRGLAADPEKRFADMGELLRALHRGRQRRRRGLFVAAALALLVGGGAVVNAWSDGENACAEHRNRLDGVWDGPSEEALRESLQGTGQPYAEATAQSVAARLDGYTQQWVSQREQTCRESLAAVDAMSAPRLEREARCLDGRLAAVEALTRLVIEHPDEVVEHAVDAAAALPSIEDCARRSLAVPREAGPSRVDREQLAALQQQLARAQANFDAANFDAGEALARALVHAADTAGELELRARSRLLLGRVEAQLARAPEADDTLFRAHELVLALGDAELIASTLVARAEVERRLLGRYEEAERLLRLARVQVDELGLGDDVRAQLEQESVLLLRKQGRYAEALAAGERALAIRERRGQGQPSKVGDAYMALAEVHYKTRDFVAAERHIRKAQQAWSRSQGTEHPSTSAGEQRLGDMAWRTGRYDEALAHHRRAHAIELAARGPEHPHTWARAMGLANVQAALGQHRQAYPTLVAALVHFEQVLGPEHPSSISAQLNLGSALVEAGYPFAAEPHLRAALEGLERDYDETSPSLPYVLLDLGRVRAATRRHDEAIVYFEAALAAWEEALGGGHPKLAWAWRELGAAHLELGNKVAAERAFRSAIAVHDVTTSDPLHLGDLHLGLARSLGPGEREAAQHHLQQALALYGDATARADARVEARTFAATL